MHLFHEFSQPLIFRLEVLISPDPDFNGFPFTFNGVGCLLKIKTSFFVLKVSHESAGYTYYERYS